MMKGPSALFLISATVFLLARAHPSHAQGAPNDRPPLGPPPTMTEPPREDSAKIQMWIYGSIEKFLKLDEATSRRLKPIFIEYSEARGKLMREHAELSQRIVKEVEDDETLIADLKTLVRRYKSIDRSIWQEREKFYKRSQEILDDRQMVKLIVFEDKMKDDLFRKFRQTRERGGAHGENEMMPAPGADINVKKGPRK